MSLQTQHPPTLKAGPPRPFSFFRKFVEHFTPQRLGELGRGVEMRFPRDSLKGVRQQMRFPPHGGIGGPDHTSRKLQSLVA